MHDVSDRLSSPVFIIGMPRSGTKLLRDLLKMNPGIGIPNSETSFWPRLIKKFGVKQEFLSRKIRTKLIKEFKKTSFVRYSGMLVDEREIIENKCHIGCWNDVFRCLLGPYVKTTGIIVDKTPDYLFAIALLLRTFDGVKFVHIIRDPRDCALSARKVWGKDLLRVVAQWQKGMSYVSELKNIGILGSSNYVECRYEDLLDNPANVLSDICEFLGVEFVEEMTTLNAPSENYGDAQGLNSILKKNCNKYKKYLNHAEIERIEEIAFDGLKEKGYDIQYAIELRELNTPEYFMRYCSDVFNIVKFRIRDEGLVHGIITQIILFSERFANRITRKI